MANIHHPPSLINAYLAAKVDPRFSPTTSTNGQYTNNTAPMFPDTAANVFKFFPTAPTDINLLTESFPEGNGVFAIYDRMLRMRRSAFPHIKCEQVMYYFYSFGEGSVEDMVVTQALVEELLNRGDESAQELNEWALANPGTWQDASKPVFFHNFKVYQLQETRDIIDFGTARTYAGNKIIVDFDWHKG
jgi:hypothetical protein